MAEIKKSKTDVSSRAKTKGVKPKCKFCKKDINIVLTVSYKGKKKFRRACCED